MRITLILHTTNATGAARFRPAEKMPGAVKQQPLTIPRWNFCGADGL
jgi:hypothetical protein